MFFSGCLELGQGGPLCSLDPYMEAQPGKFGTDSSSTVSAMKKSALACGIHSPALFQAPSLAWISLNPLGPGWLNSGPPDPGGWGSSGPSSMACWASCLYTVQFCLRHAEMKLYFSFFFLPKYKVTLKFLVLPPNLETRLGTNKLRIPGCPLQLSKS